MQVFISWAKKCDIFLIFTEKKTLVNDNQKEK